MPSTLTQTPRRRGILRSFVRWVVIGVVFVWLLAALTLVALRRIDPSKSHKRQRRKQPNKHYPNDNPSNKGSENTPPPRSLGECTWHLQSDIRIPALWQLVTDQH